MTTRSVVIIGSGPSGLTAAIYAARANLDPLVIEGEPSSGADQPGGQLMLTTDIENFPGFVDGIEGPELMSRFRDQAKRFGTEFITARATKVDFSQHPFRTWVGEQEFVSDSVIISTGAKSKMLGLPAEDRLIGRGLSTCATCDGFFFRDKTVAVVGGGDSALEEASFLTKFASKVYVIHRRDSLRASKIMQERAFKNPKLEFIWNTVVEEIRGENKVEALALNNTADGATTDLQIDGVFIAIGHIPNTSIFKDQVEMHENGYIKTVPGTTRTNIEGVFAAGDVQDSNYRQAITAAGSGCMAAIEAERWLESHEAVSG